MNLVAIVGRPNVGKSTLFNRLIEEKRAIVHDEPGITRDRIYGTTDWNEKRFSLIDTGGFIPGSEDEMEKAVRLQAMMAVEEADVIIFLCDGRTGITKFDEDIARVLKRSNKKVVLVINKCDNANQDLNSYEFYKLGLGDPFSISALTGRSTGEFLDVVVEDFQKPSEEVEDSRLKLAFVGRPNSGKSSLTNALLGKKRSIVTDIPGTTRDAIDSVLKYHSEEIVLIDTAGLRKKAQVSESIEFYSTVRTGRAIERCDIGVVIVDATRGMEEQDKRIINQLNVERKGIVIVINKWDLLEKDHKTADKMTATIKEEMRTFDYVPVLYVSALTKQRIIKIIETTKEIFARRNTRISTSKLNDVILPALDKIQPPNVRGHNLRINYITQTNTAPPVFALFSNFPQLIPEAYKRFIERTLREHLDVEGTPISLIFRKKNMTWEEREEHLRKYE
ncbi:MAG: ribosome biogenesis GTPase Der [Candidatus Kapabacteria bacterium]|nr:ribosome biogenesis GTPase Der [Candidatus Kapabacteria bacterium]